MNDDPAAPPTIWTPPPMVAVFGDLNAMRQLYACQGYQDRPMYIASIDVGADNAAAAMVGESCQNLRWCDRETDKPSPQRLAAREALRAFMFEQHREVALEAFWSAVEHVLATFKIPSKARAFMAVPLRTAAEFAALQQRAPWLVALHLEETRDHASPGMDEWPDVALAAEVIVTMPAMPTWLSASQNRSEYVAAWRRLMFERVASLAYTSYDDHVKAHATP